MVINWTCILTILTRLLFRNHNCGVWTIFLSVKFFCLCIYTNTTLPTRAIANIDLFKLISPILYCILEPTEITGEIYSHKVDSLVHMWSIPLDSSLKDISEKKIIVDSLNNICKCILAFFVSVLYNTRSIYHPKISSVSKWKVFTNWIIVVICLCNYTFI